MITPDQAQNLLDGATPGPWMLNPQGCVLVDDGTNDPLGPHGFIGTMWKAGDPDNEGNGHLMAAAPELAQTIAGMTWEWREEHKNDRGIWCPGLWRDLKDAAVSDMTFGASMAFPTRLVRRLASAPEVTDGE